jgi:hypothetical protein
VSFVATVFVNDNEMFVLCSNGFVCSYFLKRSFNNNKLLHFRTRTEQLHLPVGRMSWQSLAGRPHPQPGFAKQSRSIQVLKSRRTFFSTAR